MSSSCPPQLHLELPPNTTSFKRSFDQFGFDLESPLGPDGVGTSGNDGNDRNKRARSASPFSDDERSIGSSSSSTLASGSSSLNNGSTHESSLDAHLSPRLSVPHLSLNISRSSLEPPRLPTPVIQEIDMADYPLPDAEEAEEEEPAPPVAVSVQSDASQGEGNYRLSLERFNAFDAQIAVLRRSPAPSRSPTPPPVLPPLELLGEEVPISTNNISFLHPPAQPSPPLPHSLYHYGPPRNQRPRFRPNSRNEHPLGSPRRLSHQTNTQTIPSTGGSNGSSNAHDSPTYETWSRTTQASRLSRGDDLYRNDTPWPDWPSNAAETGDDDRDDEVEEEEEVEEVLEQPNAISVWNSPIPALAELRSPSPLFNHLDELDAQPPPPPPSARRQSHDSTPPTLPSIEDQILSLDFDPMRDVLNIFWSNDDSRPPRLAQRLHPRYQRISDDLPRRDRDRAEPTSPHPHERPSTPNSPFHPSAHTLPLPVSSGWLGRDGPWFIHSSEEEPGPSTSTRAAPGSTTNVTSAASTSHIGAGTSTGTGTSSIPAAIDAYVASQQVLNAALEGFDNVLRESEITLESYLRENNADNSGGGHGSTANAESTPSSLAGGSSIHVRSYSRAGRSPARRSSTGRTSAWRSTSGTVHDVDGDREWSRRTQRHSTPSAPWRLEMGRYLDDEHDWPMHDEASEMPVHRGDDAGDDAPSVGNDEDLRTLLARYSSSSRLRRPPRSPTPPPSPPGSLETLRSTAAALQAAVRDIAQLSSVDRSSPQPPHTSWYDPGPPRRHVDLPTNTSMLFNNPVPPPVPALSNHLQNAHSTDGAPSSRWSPSATRASLSNHPTSLVDRERERERRDRDRDLQRLRARLGTPSAPTSTLFSSSTLSNLRPRPYVSQSSTHAFSDQPLSSSSSSRASPAGESTADAVRRTERLRLIQMQRERIEARAAPPPVEPLSPWSSTLSSRINPRPRGFDAHPTLARHLPPDDNRQSRNEMTAERRSQMRARIFGHRPEQSPDRHQDREPPSRLEGTSILYDAAMDTLGYPHRLPSRNVTREPSPERSYPFPPSYRPVRRSVVDRLGESTSSGTLPNAEGSRSHLHHLARRYASLDDSGRDRPEFLPIPSLPSPGFEFEFPTAVSRAPSVSERSHVPSSSSRSGAVQPPPRRSPSPVYRRRFDWSPPRPSPTTSTTRDFDPDMFASGPFRNTMQSFYSSRSRDGRPTSIPQSSATTHLPRYVAPPPPSLPPLAFEEDHRHPSSSRSGGASEDFSSMHRNEPTESVPHLRAFLSRHPLPQTERSSSSLRMDDLLEDDILDRIAPQGNTTQPASAHPPLDDRSPLTGPPWMFEDDEAPSMRTSSVSGPRPPWRASHPPRVPPPEPRNSDLHNFLMRHPRMEAVRREASRRPLPSPTQGDEDGFTHAIDVLRHDGLSSSRSQDFINQYHREHRRDPRSLSTLTSPWGLLEEDEGNTSSRHTASSTEQAHAEPPTLPLSSMLPRRRRVHPGDPMFDYDDDDLDLTSPFGPRPMTRHYRGPGQAPVFPRRVGAFMRLGGAAMRRANRPLGDYMRDEDFNSDYESLLSLAATIGEVKSRSTPDDVINGLETGLYKDWQTPDSDHRCPICLDDYQPDDTLLKLPECSHWQHRECLQQWLKSASTCPVCRKTVVAPSSSQARTRRGLPGPPSSDAERRDGLGGGSGRGDDDGEANSSYLGFEGCSESMGNTVYSELEY
ncbi:hypothetical protein H0H92_005015 [Tricholoma furcatifolium]|nr:hypothetical protein H0H92_005015 [Tricholoma furcatifolium]